jgi:hypothetical protein
MHGCGLRFLCCLVEVAAAAHDKELQVLRMPSTTEWGKLCAMGNIAQLNLQRRQLGRSYPKAPAGLGAEGAGLACKQHEQHTHVIKDQQHTNV